MRKKLAIGLLCALICGANLTWSRVLQAEQSPICPFIPCVQEPTWCTNHAGCAGCFPWWGYPEGWDAVCLSSR
jgi:hypothetical protein